MHKTRLLRIDALHTARIFATLYLVIGIIAVPFLLLAALIGKEDIGIGFALVFPLFYAVLGFLGIVVLVSLFNWISGKWGGIEVTWRAEPPYNPGVEGTGATTEPHTFSRPPTPHPPSWGAPPS